MMEFVYQSGRPLVNCLLFNQNKFIRADMLVDSGADISVISHKIGEALGFKVETGDKIEEFSGFGGSTSAIRKKLIIKLGQAILKINIAWSLEEKGVPNVLGRQDLFDWFDIEFKQRQGKIIFKQCS